MTSAWFWKMDYCQRKSIPPAQTWAWDKAEKAYQEFRVAQDKSTALHTAGQIVNEYTADIG